SSDKAQRGFCVECGTPLTFEPGGPIEIAVGAFDDPSAVAPTIQVNPADKVSFFDGLCALPTRKDGTEPQAEAFKAAVVSFQHPDHDTTQWPPRGSSMSATAHPKLGLRPFLPADASLLREIFRDSIEELTADDYTEAQQQAWASAADDTAAFGKKLAGELTLIATLEGSPVGFASLEGKDKIDMLYVHP